MRDPVTEGAVNYHGGPVIERAVNYYQGVPVIEGAVNYYQRGFLSLKEQSIITSGVLSLRKLSIITGEFPVIEGAVNCQQRGFVIEGAVNYYQRVNLSMRLYSCIQYMNTRIQNYKTELYKTEDGQKTSYAGIIKLHGNLYSKKNWWNI